MHCLKECFKTPLCPSASIAIRLVITFQTIPANKSIQHSLSRSHVSYIEGSLGLICPPVCCLSLMDTICHINNCNQLCSFYQNHQNATKNAWHPHKPLQISLRHTNCYLYCYMAFSTVTKTRSHAYICCTYHCVC